MKILPVGAELFHADGRTDRQTDIMMLIVASGNFANAPKILWWIGGTAATVLDFGTRRK